VIFAVNKHARTKCDACGVFGGWNAADPFTDRPAHETARAHSRWHGWVMYRCEDGCDLDLCASCATFARTEEPPHGSECPQRAPQGGSAIEVRDARATIRGEFAGEHAAPYRADAGGWRYSFEDISRTIERIAARMPPRPEPTPHARAVDADAGRRRPRANRGGRDVRSGVREGRRIDEAARLPGATRSRVERGRRGPLDPRADQRALRRDAPARARGAARRALCLSRVRGVAAMSLGEFAGRWLTGRSTLVFACARVRGTWRVYTARDAGNGVL
jgi:hypothetical protein